MNKIFKVIYSKTRHCYIVVSELAKSHCKTTQSHTVRSKTALTAAVLLALGAFSFVGMPSVQADGSLYRNDYVGTNYKKDDGSSYSAKETKNYHGAGAVGVGSNTLGMNAIAGKNTVTIGDRDASLAQESVYIGSKYDANNHIHPSSGKSVVSVGYGSDAAGTGSIAIGSGASADAFDNAGSGTNPDKASQSIAIGNNAQAKQNNIAIGAGSVATATASTADAYLTGQAAVSSYVSVGGGTVTTTDPKTKKMTTTTTLRRLTNVADGAADSDVATVGQLKKLSDKAGVYNEGWGIKIGDYTKKDANGQETTVKNAISIDRNLGSNEITSKSNNTFKAAGENSLILGGAGTDDFVASNGKHREKDYGSYGKDSVLVGGENNKTTKDGTYAVISGGGQNIASGEHSFIGGGWWNTATGATSTVVGGQANTASGNQSTIVGGDSNRAIGDESSILGGNGHTAVGESSTISGGVGAYTLGSYSSVSGGQGNVAIGMTSSADGGWLNFAYGDTSQVSGGYSNYALGNYSNSLGGRNGVVQGNVSVGIAGGSTGAGAGYALAAGYQSVVTGDGVRREKSDDVDDAIMEAGKGAQGNEGYKYTDVATALGYQATANETNTVSFGHDKGDVSGYTVNWDIKYDTDDQGNIKFNEDGMPLVESIKANGITTNHYDSAKYNRLVKVADGINNHDVVVMEQLRNADNVGKNAKNNVVVYKENQVDENGEAIIDVDASKAATEKATEQAIKDSEDAWGSALGTGKVEANNSQLVTGDTVYNAIQNQAEWKLTTNDESADKAVAIKPGTTVNFSAEKNGKDHRNVTISHNGSNVTIGLDKDIVLGDTSHSSGGSLNVYTDSSDGNNLSNHVSINGSTISVNYPKSNDDKKTPTDTRGVVIGVGEDSKGNGDGYIAFNNSDGRYTYLHSATDAEDSLKDRLEYVGTSNEPKYIANLDDGITFEGDVKGKLPDDSREIPTKLNTTIKVVGGAETKADLTEGNIGVISRPAAEDKNGKQTQTSQLEIKLNKDLKGITSISNQTTTDGTTTGAIITLSKKGTIITGGTVAVGGSGNTASGDNAIVSGGTGNTAVGGVSAVYGGWMNTAFGTGTAIMGGRNNDAFGDDSVANGGQANIAYGDTSTVVGGFGNFVCGNLATSIGGWYGVVNGAHSVGILGGSTSIDAPYTLAAGHQSVVTGTGLSRRDMTDKEYEELGQGKQLASGVQMDGQVFDNFATAIGDKATADAPQTISFGHDKGDVSGYKIIWKERADGERNPDGTIIDYNDFDIQETHYDSAYYNRLVKAADGIEDHDAVVMEQLKNASGVGSNVKVYNIDENGNVQFDAENTPIEDPSKEAAAQQASKTAWGQALGADAFSKGTTTTATNASTSDQLVTGKTLYAYDKPTGSTNYVKVNNTTGQNLSALDAQVKANADELNKPNRNIKYYSVKTLPLTVDGYTNENNDGAKGKGSLAAGFVTHADGIASTVAGSYSGVINSGNVQGRDLRGAAALSYGTFNVNQNTDTAKEHSGVANSIVGQANMTTNSNAAIIYGAGNTVTDSYRQIKDKAKAILGSVSDPTKLSKAMQDAVKESGGQVMVMGGGNTVNKAYMTQVTGVGNTVTGADSTYAEGTSTQYNFVDGFQNELTNGKHDYIIGSNNTVSGNSIDKNQSNIVFGDNHKLTDQKNNVIIGSSDTTNDETTASDVVAIGHNAKVSAEGGVAIGSGSEVAAAPTEKVSGYDPTTKTQSADKTSHVWNATTGAVSIGTSDGTVTRQINGVAAGTNDTDAVNVAQLKKLEGMKANVDALNIGKNITVAPIYKTDDNGQKVIDQKATEDAQEAARTANENAWGTAIGTGEIAKDNGQLVTGKTVYDALHGGLDDVVFGHDGKDGKDGKDGSIGLVGPKGQDGKDGKTTTIIKTETGAAGVNGKDGKDGITRIVYNDTEDPANKHTVATLDDGMKYVGDTGNAANVKLDHQLKLSGTTFDEKDENKKYKDTDWTSGNIAVVSGAADEKTGDATMYLKLNKDLNLTDKGSVRFGDKDGNTTLDASGLTIKSTVTKEGKPEVVNGPSITKDGINGGDKQITNVGDGIKKNTDGSYTISETDKKNAANIGDVQTIVDKATKDLTDGTNGLNKKANVDASNIGSNITVDPIYQKDNEGHDVIGKDGKKVIDQKATDKAATEARTANENAWGTAIGTGEVAKDNGQLVTGGKVYDALHGGLTDITVGKAGKDGKDGKDGAIGLVGQTGQKGKDGKNAYATTIIKTEKGVDGVDGKNGEDGITRIVYNDTNDPANKHTVATLDDGMKYVGDTGATANVKLDHQLKLSGTTFDEKDKKYNKDDWTPDNIAVVSGAADETTGDATMYLKLNKDLNLTDNGSVRFGDKNSSTTLDASGLTIKSTVTKEGKPETVNGPSITIDGINGGGKAITNISSGIEKDDKGNYTDKSKSSAANINDVQTIVNDAKKDLTDGKNGLNNKANVDASNIGENLKDADGRAASTDAVKTNKYAWASAIGTNEVKEGNNQLVTSDAVAKELAKKADKSYVDQELGKKADKTYVDEKLDTKANKSDVYTKTEVDSKVADITNGLGDKANKDLDNISDKGKTVIKNLAKGAVKVIAGTNTTITEGKDGDAKTYAVNVENGKVASGDTGLISGDTLYKEVHVDKDGSYIKSGNTVGQNLSSLDTGLKTTSDLIHTNTTGDTIQIGGNSTATKIDVNGKDGKGRVITGVVSDANDPNSAANVGYVNGLTAANTQQIYRDMNNAYSRLDTNINRAAAGSNALAALHPLDFDPADKASFAVGYGHYRNANAAAVGAFYQPNANTMVNMGISLGNGDPGFNAGVSFKIGKGSAYNGVSKAEMAQTIHDQATEISAIKADDAAKDKRIDALEKENQEMKKQIQEILARLNG